VEKSCFTNNRSIILKDLEFGEFKRIIKNFKKLRRTPIRNFKIQKNPMKSSRQPKIEER